MSVEALRILSRDDATLRLRGEVAEWTSVEVVTRWGEVGTFALDLPAAAAVAADLTEPRASVVVEALDGTPIIAGPVTAREWRWEPAGARVTVAGLDDAALLARLYTEPNPGATERTFGGSPAQVMRALLAHAAERDPRLVVPEPETESQVVTLSETVQREPISEVLDRVALIADRVARVRWDEATATLIGELVAPRDRTRAVVFAADLGNLAQARWRDAAPQATRATLLGEQVEGSPLLTATAIDADAETEWGRIEVVADASTADDATTIDAQAQATLDAARALDLDLVVLDTGSSAWPDAWQLGDRVTVDLPLDPSSGLRVALPEVVREVTITGGADGVRVTPRVASPHPSSRLPLAGAVRDALRRVRRMEVRR